MKNIQTRAKSINKKSETSVFFQNVYAIVEKIPHGRVTTYGSIAKALGAVKSSRIVGYAMNESHFRVPNLPAHRVVNKNGILTGKNHFSAANTMQELLDNEGITISNDQIQNFKEFFWDPSLELI